MRIIQVEAYTFPELSPEIQKIVLEKYRNVNVEDLNWWEFIYDDAKNIGLIIKSFDLYQNTIECEFSDDPEDTAFMIIADHGESSPTVTPAKDYLVSLKVLTDAFEKEHPEILTEYGIDYPIDLVEVENLVEMENIDRVFLEELGKVYLDMLHKDCEYLTSDEAIKDFFINNNYEFTLKGKTLC